jgi:Ice-binding-like
MLKTMRSLQRRLIVLLVPFAIAILSGCSCRNCAVPAFNPTPVPTSTPVALSCAQNAITGQGVPLGSDATFAVLAASTVTNSGPTIVTGDLGVSPGSAVTGFPPGTVTGGAIHAADPTAAQAQLDLTTAYNNAAGRVNPTAVPADIGGTVITPGLYKAPVSLAITGNVTLDGQNNPNSVFIFQMASTLTTSVNSTVTLINRANACNIFWQVGSSATLNTASIFNGNILAQASISLGTGATVNGRVLARTGAVTLLSNIVTKTGP